MQNILLALKSLLPIIIFIVCSAVLLFIILKVIEKDDKLTFGGKKLKFYDKDLIFGTKNRGSP